MSEMRKAHVFRWRPEGPTRRLGGFILPETQADWVERIAEDERRPVAEVVRLLVQQGLKVYSRGSLICDWPDGCSRVGCCGGGARSTVAELTPPRVLSFPEPKTPRDPSSPAV